MLPEKFGFTIIEPLKDLYKDEVRKLGEKLNLPKKLLWRHPFPGPGLAIRIVGEITKSRLAILQEADWVYLDADPGRKPPHHSAAEFISRF